MLQLQYQVYTLAILLLIAIIYLVIYNYKLKSYKPTDKPTGIILLTELFVNSMDNIVEQNLGKKWVKNFGAYAGTLAFLIFLGTIVSIIGLPPITLSFSITLALSIVTFVMMHYVAIKSTKWNYFKRFAEPFVFFIPVNLIAMWAPLVSLSMRLFANILAGAIIISMTYGLTGWISSYFAPFDILRVLVGPFFHAYFDLFAGLIQTVVFISLTVIFISQEQ